MYMTPVLYKTFFNVITPLAAHLLVVLTEVYDDHDVITSAKVFIALPRIKKSFRSLLSLNYVVLPSSHRLKSDFVIKLFFKNFPTSSATVFNISTGL